MRNPWRALLHDESPHERRRLVELAHERLVAPGATSPSVGAHAAGKRAPLPSSAFDPSSASIPVDRMRDVVLESWRRSLDRTIDPDGAPARIALDEAALAAARARHPLALALPVVRRLLVEDAAEAGLVVAIGDAGGRLLWVDGDRRIRSRAEDIGFAAGADWSEASVGTSAPGSALALDHGIQVLGAEHYNRWVHEWSCTAVPVHDPVSRELLGVIDITGHDEAVAPHTLSLVEATVAAVEAELRVAAMRERFERATAASGATGAGARGGAGDLVDAMGGAARDDRLAVLLDAAGPRGDRAAAGRLAAAAPDPGSTRPARLRTLGRECATLEWTGGGVDLVGRHAELVVALALAGRTGLTAADLGERVYGSPAAAATARPEVARLRRLLERSRAPLGIESRPYRLDRAVSLDAHDTLSAVERGAHRLALAGYEGSVLPWSDAPVVRELRDDVDATLREAMLQRAAPDALFAYADAWAGDDAEAWRTLLQVLPARSPRRARALARIEALEAGEPVQPPRDA